MFKRILRKLFRYKESRTIYRIGSLLIKLMPWTSWVLVKTPYGLILHPKDFRVLSMKFDMVEPEIQGVFEEWVREADVFIDIGAAAGWYILKAERLNPKAFKIAMEPDSIAYTILKANLAINGLLLNKNIITINLACAEEEKEITITTCISGLGSITVKAKPLDKILEELGIELSSKSLVMIDVEGAGYSIIKGAETTLKKYRPKIIMELHKEEEPVPEYLRSLGYEIYRPPKYFVVAH